MEMIFLLVGLAIGFILGKLLNKSKNKDEQPNLEEANQLLIEKTKLETLLSSETENLQQLKVKLTQSETRSEGLFLEKNKLETDFKVLEEKLNTQTKNLEELQSKFTLEFENIATKILKQNSSEFSKSNERQIGELLNPLKEKITHFQERIQDNSEKTRLSNEALKQQIIGLKELNEQMSKDALNLTKALKGDSKTQGNWGEVQLENILLKAGLTKDIHYRKEEVHKTEEGNILRPDYIINLPDEKSLIVDSKVSLTAYNNYFNAENELHQQEFLKDHTTSIANHIKLLSEKSYEKIHDIQQPDYVLMFLANEPALTLALKTDSTLFEKALERNIVLVSTSTLLATLRTISYIWKTDSQNKNAKAIADRAGKLYEQFKRFADDLITVGTKLNNAKESYDSAMKRLSDGKGNIVGQIEKLKKLGADTTQNINPSLVERAVENDNLIDE